MITDMMFLTKLLPIKMMMLPPTPLFTAAADQSNGIQLTQSAHYYTECSNKGLCDRTVGTCACFVGYEGNACQRTTCPNSCSGHGVCKTIRELAAFDYDNVYELWDADVVRKVATSEA